MYGKTPVPISNEIQKKLIGDEEVVNVKPSELLKPQMEAARKEISEYIERDEDVLSYILFPQQAISYFEFRQAQRLGFDPAFYDKQNKVYPI